jgi:D-tyrosyl-tRNA(Tyr) deacylase
MKVLIQRVNWSSIACFWKNNEIIHNDNIQKWLLIYIGIHKDDILNQDKIISQLIKKIVNLPLFDDKNWKITLSLKDINGEIMIIPNFTLQWRNKKWTSIDYTNAAKFNEAKNLFEKIVENFKKSYPNKVAHGIFWSYMKIQSEVDWPVNFVLEI